MVTTEAPGGAGAPDQDITLLEQLAAALGVDESELLLTTEMAVQREQTAVAANSNGHEAPAAIEEDDEEMQMALALSMSSPLPGPRYVDDAKEVEKATKESLEEAAAEEKKRADMRWKEDPELFEAALRASLMDLGPLGISQAAKIMATGDDTLGHAKVLKRTGTHTGAGAAFVRKDARSSTEPAMTPSASLKASGSAQPTITSSSSSKMSLARSAENIVAAAASSSAASSPSKSPSKAASSSSSSNVGQSAANSTSAAAAGSQAHEEKAAAPSPARPTSRPSGTTSSLPPRSSLRGAGKAALSGSMSRQDSSRQAAPKSKR
mmetsp:Transcript_44114/g.104385  ORF Transcript_44114/g.104385 Transcript_44114/m.104385 type:complete len:322 (-) Transcript_44114:140-1105(-)